MGHEGFEASVRRLAKTIRAAAFGAKPLSRARRLRSWPFAEALPAVGIGEGQPDVSHYFRSRAGTQCSARRAPRSHAPRATTSPSRWKERRLKRQPRAEPSRSVRIFSRSGLQKRVVLRRLLHRTAPHSPHVPPFVCVLHWLPSLIRTDPPQTKRCRASLPATARPSAHRPARNTGRSPNARDRIRLHSVSDPRFALTATDHAITRAAHRSR